MFNIMLFTRRQPGGTLVPPAALDRIGAGASGLVVHEVTSRRAFRRLEAEWDGLVEESNDQPFYRHGFLRIWIDSFASESKLRVLVARDAAGGLAAGLPLIERRGRLHGLPTRQLISTANHHSCRFDLIARDPPAASRAFLRHLSARPGWDLLRIEDVPEGGAAWSFLTSARELGLPAGSWDSIRSPHLALPASFEELSRRLTGKFRSNLRRRRRRLEEMGPVALERVSGEEGLEGSLEEAFRLEEQGWKGERGSAIAQSGETLAFYRELAREAARGSQLSLYFFKVDGRAIAFHYALEHRGTYYLLKPGYDESLASLSPGHLIMEEVLRDCIRRKLVQFDFLGPCMVWKEDWTELVRPHSWIYVFRDCAYGRALWTQKFRCVPLVKKLVNRVSAFRGWSSKL